MPNPVLAVAGNLTADPEVRFTPAGVAVARFTVAFTPRVMRNNEWTDGDPSFYDCTAWRQLAEQIAANFGKGARVVVLGTLGQQHWTNDAGEKRSRWVLTVEDLGASVQWANVKITKMVRRGETSPDDPWATASTARPEAPVSDDDEPPF